jgi:hypothetical protein
MTQTGGLDVLFSVVLFAVLVVVLLAVVLRRR